MKMSTSLTGRIYTSCSLAAKTEMCRGVKPFLLASALCARRLWTIWARLLEMIEWERSAGKPYMESS